MQNYISPRNREEIIKDIAIKCKDRGIKMDTIVHFINMINEGSYARTDAEEVEKLCNTENISNER